MIDRWALGGQAYGQEPHTAALLPPNDTPAQYAGSPIPDILGLILLITVGESTDMSSIFMSMVWAFMEGWKCTAIKEQGCTGFITRQKDSIIAKRNVAQ